MTATSDKPALSAELERAAADPQAKTIFDLIDRQKPELEKVVGQTIGVERFTDRRRIAMQTFTFIGDRSRDVMIRAKRRTRLISRPMATSFVLVEPSPCCLN